MDEDINFLGQTPLHLAVGRPSVFCLVLDSTKNIDAPDIWGTTPLMYAAAAGNTTAVRHLILKRARPLLREDRPDGCKRSFLDYAITYSRCELVLEVLELIGATDGEVALQDLARWAIMRLISVPRYSHMDERSLLLRKIISLCHDVNFTFYDSHQGVKNNNLMHYAKNVEEAEALFASGFTAWNQANSQGEIALHTLAQLTNPTLIRFSIENGANVNHICEEKRSPLFNLFSQLGSSDWGSTWNIADSILVCVDAGADVFLRDDCRCCCSPLGCDISAVFQLNLQRSSWVSEFVNTVWILELVSLVEEVQSIESARKLMRIFIRRLEFEAEETAITHVCCHRGLGIGMWCLSQQTKLPEDDIDEILIEESEFVEIFEERIRSLCSSPSLEDLQRTWMLQFKEHYQIRLAAVKANKEELRLGNRKVRPVNERQPTGLFSPPDSGKLISTFMV